MFSRSCQYALQAVVYIHLNSEDSNAVKIKDISESQKIHLHFLGKILQILVKHKILASLKGPTGGFLLEKGKENMRLLEIVQVVDGLDIFERCGIGLKQCSDETPCPIHNEYKEVKQKIKDLRAKKTIAELCQDVEEGESIVNFAQT